jgi:hypothetical protein
VLNYLSTGTYLPFYSYLLWKFTLENDFNRPLYLVVVVDNAWMIEMIRGWMDVIGIMHGLDRYIDT